MSAKLLLESKPFGEHAATIATDSKNAVAITKMHALARAERENRGAAKPIIGIHESPALRSVSEWAQARRHRGKVP